MLETLEDAAKFIGLMRPWRQARPYWEHCADQILTAAESRLTWRDGESWRLHEAALHGSSHYDLPTVLRWITANIGIHHVHHLCSRIPYYRLPQVLRDHPELIPIGRLTPYVFWLSFFLTSRSWGSRELVIRY